MKKKIVLSNIFVVVIVCATVLSACNPQEKDFDTLRNEIATLRNEYDGLRSEFDALKKENLTLQDKYDMLQDEYDALMDGSLLPFNAKLCSYPIGIVVDLLFSEYDTSEMNGKIFIIRSIDEFDEIFTDELKAEYDLRAASPYYPELTNFDTDIPRDSFNFSEKMLVIYVYRSSNTGFQLALNSVGVRDKTLSIVLKPYSDQLAGDLETVLCVAIELDNIDIDNAEVSFTFR